MLDVRRQEPWVVVLQSAACRHKNVFDLCSSVALCEKQKRGTKRKRDDEPYVINEDEPEIPDDFICLDWFNSDLTMKINKENFSAAEPFHVAAWGYIFSSARATHGFTSGKIAFEVKWVKNMEVKLDDVKEPHELRVGWSSDDCNLQVMLENPLRILMPSILSLD